MTERTPGMASSERARGEGMCGEEERNSIVGERGGRRECSVGMNLRAWSLGVGRVWMKTVRWREGSLGRRGGRRVALVVLGGRVR
jgi:hypothetical protein